MWNDPHKVDALTQRNIGDYLTKAQRAKCQSIQLGIGQQPL